MTTSSFSVRHVVPADAEPWRALRNALWPDYEGDFHASEVADFFKNSPRQYLMMPEAVLVAIAAAAADAPTIVGFAEVSRRIYAEGCRTSPVGFLEGWYVVPEWRGRGVGAALVRAAEDWARGLGCAEFASDALVDNDVSRAAHLALGFEEVEVIRCFRKSLSADDAP